MSKSTSTRAIYVGLFFITSFIAFIMMFWGSDILSWVPTLKVCTPDDDAAASNSNCYGVFAVYRICFGLFLFHFIFSLFLIRVRDSGDPRAGIQDGWWIVKFVLWVGLIVVAFVIPNGFYKYYGYISFVGAFFFILVQLVLLIDMAYTWTESWVRKWQDRDDNRWYYALLSATGVMYALAITGFVLIFVYFGRGDRSGLNLGITIFAVIICLMLSYMSVSPKVQDAVPNIGLLQSAVVTLYTTYLIGSAFLSEPCTEADVTQCSNRFGASDSGGQVMSIVFGALFTICAVCYSTIRAAGSGTLVGKSESESLLEEGETTTSTLSNDGDDDHHHHKEENDDEAEGVTYNYSFFHLMFATAAMYICQLLTNWSVVSSSSSAATSGSDSSSITYYVDSGMAAVWIKIVSSWLALGLYGWTMVGPLMFPDRDWTTN